MFNLAVNMKLAAIDIGSNAMRLLIGNVFEADGRMHITKLSLIRLPVRLGSDVFNSGSISDKKAQRFIKGMKAFDTIRKIHEVEDLRACATSAMRDASNGKKLVEKTYHKTGIKIKIIDGKAEADLILSTFQLLSLKPDKAYLYIDVGGGSTEISIVINGESKSSRSFRIGTVRMLSKQVSNDDREQMVEWLAMMASRYSIEKAIGTGGNINKLIKICCTSNETELSKEALSDVYRSMRVLTPQERMVRWSLRSDRADVIVPASQIFLSIMDNAGVESILVPKIGLADGLLYNLYQERKAVGFGNNVLT